MILLVLKSHPLSKSDKIIPTPEEYIQQGEIIYDGYGTQIWIKKPNDELLHLADVRGWGAISSEFGDKEGAKLQDGLGKFIVEAINEKIKTLK